jgi:hypothetical protein
MELPHPSHQEHDYNRCKSIISFNSRPSPPRNPSEMFAHRADHSLDLVLPNYPIRSQNQSQSHLLPKQLSVDA